MAKEKNPQIQEASEVYDYLIGDEAIQRLAFLKRKWELDYNSGLQNAKDEGIELGEKKKQVEIAKRMKLKGIDINTIVDLTGLSAEEIDKI